MSESEVACEMLTNDSCFVRRVDTVYVGKVKSLKALIFYEQGKGWLLGAVEDSRL